MLGFDFGFGLYSGIDVVVAVMASWNNVSPASPYLVNVSGVDKGAVRVGVIRYVVFSMDLDSWCVIQGKLFTGLWWNIFDASFVWIYGNVWFLQPSGLVVEDCKSTLLLRVCPQPMFYLRLFNLIIRGRWMLRSSNTWLARAYASGPSLSCLFSVCFKLRQPAIDARKKTTSMSFFVFLFCADRVASSCNSSVPVVFLDHYKV